MAHANYVSAGQFYIINSDGRFLTKQKQNDQIYYTQETAGNLSKWELQKFDVQDQNTFKIASMAKKTDRYLRVRYDGKKKVYKSLCGGKKNDQDVVFQFRDVSDKSSSVPDHIVYIVEMECSLYDNVFLDTGNNNPHVLIYK